MGELAADACGPKKHGGNCGVAFVYRSDNDDWHVEYESVTKTLDATALEMTAVANGLGYLVRNLFQQFEPRVTVYSDASRIFEYLAGVTVAHHHEGLWGEIAGRKELLKMNGVTLEFEQVIKHRREDYPLYLMADALTRHARTLMVPGA